MRLPYVLGNTKDISVAVVAVMVAFAVIFGGTAYYLSSVMKPIVATTPSSVPTGAQPTPTSASAVVFTLTSTSTQTLTAGSVVCGGATSPQAVQVGMTNGVGGPFTPQSITVKIGVNNTVTWTNNDPKTITHTVTSNQGLFHSGDMAGNGVFTCTFTSPGTYYYRCLYHPLMVGTVIVKSQ
jgi:plastocyanin